jgi:protein-L-isoaspartate(D-aspartate) O-methyltransferase
MEYQELLRFMKNLDRSFFLEDRFKSGAYADEPLPIGFGQTISQPSLVLQMTYLLSPDKACSVLEIGTGSGYQTAILARFSRHVYTIERIKELGEKAHERLKDLGYGNVTYKTGDGSMGWSEFALFDRIIVTAAASKIPDELLEQLKAGGKMMIPVGPKYSQDLILLTKDLSGKINQKYIEGVRFVEFKGKYGWTEDETLHIS